MKDIEFLVISESDEEKKHRNKNKKTRKNIKPASKEYMKDYYMKHKGAYICQYCERIYTCRSSLVKHQGRSIKCFAERTKTVINEIKHTPAEDINQDIISTKMEAKIPIK